MPNGQLETGAAPSQLPIRDLLTVLFKRRALILIFAATVVLLVTTVTILSPSIYEVTATLLVTKARAEIPLAPNEASQLFTSQVSQQELNSEIEILRSRHLIEESLLFLGVDDSWRTESRLSSGVRLLNETFGRPQPTYFDEMVEHLQRELNIYSIRRSNVIRVSYKSNNPEWATQLVTTLTEQYLDRRAEMYRSPQAVSFFERQMSEAERRLTESEKALERYLAAAGITMVKGPQGSDSLAKQKELVLERLTGLQNQLGDVRAEIEERQRKVATLRTHLTEEPERLESSDRFHRDAATEEIEKALAALELKRDALLQDFKHDSRYVRDIEAQIRLANERLAEAHRTDVGGIDGTEINPVHQQIATELSRVEADLEGSRGRLASLQGLVAGYRKELDKLNNDAFELERLRRDVQAAEEAYLLYRKKHEEVRIAAAMDQQRLINVTVAQPAQTPLSPVAPRKRFNVLLGILVGVLGGLVLAFVKEYYFDHTITTGSELEFRLGIAHVASIPEER